MSGMGAITPLPAAGEIRVEIDWPLLLEQRQAVLDHSDLPPYLLLPEVHALRDAAPDDNTLLLIDTLWHTGARISECLALTPGHFHLDDRASHVSIQSLKKRGRPSRRAAQQKPRLLPLADEAYLRRLRRYLGSHGLRRRERLFPLTRSAVNKRLDRLVAGMRDAPSIRVTPHVLRHSFAVNAVLHGTPLPVLQRWLGHSDVQSTMIYTQVLTLETHHLMQRIRF